jgi:hypothetical protein
MLAETIQRMVLVDLPSSCKAQLAHWFLNLLAAQLRCSVAARVKYRTRAQNKGVDSYSTM